MLNHGPECTHYVCHLRTTLYRIDRLLVLLDWDQSTSRKCESTSNGQSTDLICIAWITQRGIGRRSHMTRHIWRSQHSKLWTDLPYVRRSYEFTFFFLYLFSIKCKIRLPDLPSFYYTFVFDLFSDSRLSNIQTSSARFPLIHFNSLYDHILISIIHKWTENTSFILRISTRLSSF